MGGIIMLGAYAALMLMVTAVATRRPSTTLEFHVGNRNMGSAQSALSIAATWIWAPALSTSAERAYLQGIPGLFWFLMPNIFCLLLFVPFAEKIRALMPQGVTLSGFMGERYGPGARRTYLFQLTALSVLSTGVNLLAGAAVLKTITGLPFPLLTVILAVIAFSYSQFSGIKASVLTDAVQMILILAACLLFVPWALQRNGICVTGVRMAESIQRQKYMTTTFSSKTGLARGNMAWPIYDFKDADVWRYLYEEQIEIPDIYLYLYQTGSRLNELRVSQFFSVDTAKSLVKMNEYYPDLMDRIIRREPNAYLAALYWDSEMFRRSTKNRRENEDKRDYKAEVFKILNSPRKHFLTKGAMKGAQRMIRLLIKYGSIIELKVYKTVYDCLVGGDPKQRTLRSLITTINTHYSKANNGEKERGN